MKTNLLSAVDILKNGGVGIFPTDTVYGIGCRLDNEEGIKRIFQIRKRPEEKAVLIVVNSIAMAQKYLLPIPQVVNEKLIKQYWPGGLTIILPCLVNKVPSIARGNGTTLAVRQTDHPILLQLLDKLQVPLIAPSANFAGEKTPAKFHEIDPDLLSLVDFVLDDPCGGNTPSSIIDCSVNPWKMIREGSVHVTFS